MNNKNMVCRQHKALYGLKQAPRARYERLHKYLVKMVLKGLMITTICTKKKKKGKGILLSNFFVDDSIFGGQDALCKAFENETKQEFEMSMFGEIKFFMGFQVY